jgi:hypothetical protein
LEKNQLGAPSAFAAAGFLKSEDIAVEGHGFVEVDDTIAGVEKSFDHGFAEGVYPCLKFPPQAPIGPVVYNPLG